MKVIVAVLAFAALPALAGDGFFPQPAERGEPASLRILNCTEGQVMACTVRCPAPSDGRMPAAAVCQVVGCTCEDAVRAKSGEVGTSSAVVTFNLRKLLGLPVAK